LNTINSVCRILGHAVIGVILLMMLLTVADVFMRYVFSDPITGTTEISEIMMVCLLLAMGWAAVNGNHITVDAIMNRMPKRFQAISDIIVFLVSFGIFAIIAWRSYLAGLFTLEYNRVSALLKIPDGPFYILLGVGYGFLCLSIIPILVNRIKEAFKR